MSPTSSEQLEKKRKRDRRAQIARRARQDAHVQKLEALVRQCREQHGSRCEEDVDSLRNALESLRLENADLRNRAAAVIDLLRGSPAKVQHFTVDSKRHQDGGSLGSDRDEASIKNHQIAEEVNGCHLWKQRPEYTSHGPPVASLLPWLLCPAVVLPVADVPSGADLLFGSYENPLANSIHVSMKCARFGTIRDGERLAFGWLIYIYTKWLFDPTPARYERLPHFWRPTKLQMSHAHSALVDLVLWPEIRDNVISADYDSEELVTLLRKLTPELAMPWSSLTPLLEPDTRHPGQLQIRPRCIKVFSMLENWNLPSNFIKSYPELVKGTRWESFGVESSSKIDAVRDIRG